MNKLIFTILLIFISLFMFGCENTENLAIDTNSNSINNKNIDYNIERISFSKSFQSIEPNVQVLDSKDKIRLLATLGLSEYQEIKIDKIVLEGENLNIFISGNIDKSKDLLSVPQVILNIKDKHIKHIEKLNINIVYNEYKSIDIKFKINDVLNKIESQFKLELNTSPVFNLIKSNDTIIWDISYNNIISKESENYPIINLHAQVDANSGEILDYTKDYISDMIDIGKVLSFKEDFGFLYKKIQDDEKDIIQELWFYDVLNDKKDILYTSHGSITSSKVSPDLKNITLVEKTENCSYVYIYSTDDSKIYKLQLKDNFNPQIIEWKDNETLYLLQSDDKNSIIYSYDLKSNSISFVSKTNKNIENIIAYSNKFLVVETNEKSYNKKISFTADFKIFKTINKGFNPNFIDENNIAYMKNDEKLDINHLILYNLKKEKVTYVIEKDILNYNINSNKDILYVKSNPDLKNFTLFNYSTSDKQSSKVIDIIGERAYYSANNNSIYLNMKLPFENKSSYIIYSIDLK